ncbi:MAG: hypothetical protein M3Q44_04135 [bacterium]|nr:hypothetical protein [bacterium]
MEDNFDVISRGQVDAASLKTAVERVQDVISKRREILNRYAIEDVDGKLIFGVSEAKRNLKDRMERADIPMSDEQFPDVLFIRVEDRLALSQDLAPFAGGDYRKYEGASSVMNDAVVVFLSDNELKVDQAGKAFHEMYHYIGRQVIDISPHSIIYAREGLEILNSTQEYKPWLLEEGFVTYETASFVRELGNNDQFKSDMDFRYNYRNTDEEGKITFESGMKVEPEFCNVMTVSTPEITVGLFRMPEAGSLAGSLVKSLVESMNFFERDDFINLIRQARFDTKLVKDVAQKVDAVWGRGTYAEILRCKRTDEAVWELIQKHGKQN